MANVILLLIALLVCLYLAYCTLFDFGGYEEETILDAIWFRPIIASVGDSDDLAFF